MKPVTVLIPTFNRPQTLAITLTSLALQDFKDFDVVISDQTPDTDISQFELLQTPARLLKLYGSEVSFQKHLPQQGMAEQRDFLLSLSRSDYSLFLDDDLLLEPFVLRSLYKAICLSDAGFIGSAQIGLSFIDEHRPEEEMIEFWPGNFVKPELLAPNSLEWQRFKLHNAANLLHVQSKYPAATPESPLLYKVAWIGACVLFDTAKLRAAGGFSFWKDLPVDHSGEDVYAQLQVMGTHGGAGIMPSGVYHLEVPTTLGNRLTNIPDLLPGKQSQ